MIKRTIHIGSPAKISLKQKQMVVGRQNADGVFLESTLPIEDLWAVILEDPQISVSHGLLGALLANNVALISCDERYMPTGLLLNLAGNTVQNERFRHQVECSVPLRKQLWQQTIRSKIRNQAAMLYESSADGKYLIKLSDDVRSGDPDNRESVAAAYYWPRVFKQFPGFYRERGGGFPNNLLNYGYAILRAVIARSLVGSGLLPTLGIHHHNRYNHYCLADDIMEPYRPYVDRLVAGMIDRTGDIPDDLTKELKTELLQIPVLDVTIGGKQRPLMTASSETTASLARCFEGEARNIVYPEM